MPKAQCSKHDVFPSDGALRLEHCALSEGHEGWDAYAPFYDWENARTLGRRDVPFWRTLSLQADGPVLELGCGTGRISIPLARAGVSVVGVDRSEAMLARACQRVRRGRLTSRLRLLRADIRALPFPRERFPLVIAPYGVLQSLLRERDLAATLDSVAGVLQTGGTFGLELVADLPAWDEYRKRISLSGRGGRGGAHVTLVETVRQDRARRLTIFDQQFIVSGGSGGPNNSTQTGVLYIYREAFQAFDFGVAAAAGVILFIIIFVLTLGQRLTVGRTEAA